MRTFILITLLLTATCAASQTTPQTATPKPLAITPADLSKLRWIEGAWKGTGDVDKPFYERYRFEGDSLLLVEGHDDESFSKPSDVTRFELKEGQFGNAGEGSRWVATAIDENSITFEPVFKARNTFQWKRESADLWTAILKWPATDSTPAKQRIYKMQRIPGK
jgi:hypothetical protein